MSTLARIAVSATLVGCLGSAFALTSQTITFGTLSGKTYGDVPFTVSATASSGLPVSFSSQTTSVCTVSGASVTIIAAGSCTVRASQAGDATYAAAPNVDRTFTVAKAAQTITFGALGGKTFGDAPFAVSATASSGLAVSFTSTTTSICTVSASTVTIVAAGTCTIRAAQAGNGNYNAATNVNQSFTVAKASQTITFGTLPGLRMDEAPAALSATASSGLAVAFSSATTTICTVSGTAVTLKAVGTCTINANQAGNANYLAATQVARSFTVSKGNQTVTFGALGNKTYKDPNFTVSATASSVLAVTFSSTTTTVCTVSGSTVTLVAAGTCTIRAAQAGNANWNAAMSVDQPFSVAKASQTIAFGVLPNRPMGSAAFTIAATASSNLAVTFTSTTATVCTVTANTVTVIAQGQCTIQANQAGNANYLPALGVGQGFTVTPPPVAPTFAPQVVYSTPLYPTSVVVGDFNQDGKLDVVTTNESSGTITSRLGNGDGTFSGLITSPGQAAPLGLATAEFTGDGIVDLAITDPSLGYVSIAYGVGDGSFSIAELDIGALTPGGVAFGDFNGDGFPDLVVANQSSAQTVTVYLSVDEYGFNPPMTLAVGSNPTQIIAADVNADATLDLVVINASSNSASILLGDGLGGFSTASTRSFNASPIAFALTDMNGDGKKDLVALLSNARVAVGLGDGNGTFATPSYLVLSSAGSAIVIADVNGDGFPDVAVTQPANNRVAIYVGDGTGALLASSTHLVGLNPNRVIAADLDGNGRPDLIVTNHDEGSISVLKNITTAPVPSSVVVQSGSGQSASVRARFTAALSVQVKDGAGDPVPGILVTFSASSSPPTGTFAGRIGVVQVATGPSGVATAPPFTAGNLVGSYYVSATVANQSASFLLTNTVVAPPAFVSGAPTSGSVGQPYTFNVLVTGDPEPTVSLMSGGLPPGLALEPSGWLHGTPVAPGSYSGVFAASNSMLDPPTAQSFTLSVGSGSQTIDFPQPSAHRLVDPPFSISATSTSGLPVFFTSMTPSTCSVSATTVTILAASGVCTIRASQPGDQFWTAASPVDRTLPIGLGQSIAFPTLPDRGINLTPLTLTATASSGLAVTYASLTLATCTINGASVSLVGLGSCTIRASQPGDTTYLAAPTVDRSFAIITPAAVQYLYDAAGNMIRIIRN